MGSKRTYRTLEHRTKGPSSRATVTSGARFLDDDREERVPADPDATAVAVHDKVKPVTWSATTDTSQGPETRRLAALRRDGRRVAEGTVDVTLTVSEVHAGEP